MRTVDDKIVYMLNTSIPTESFKGQVDPTATCKQLYEELKSSYDTREAAIKKCITLTAERVKELKVQRESRVDDISLLKNLRKEQTKLRLLQSELNVEEVVKERSTKVYYERCRPFFKPADIEL
ncbi:protein MIX23 isoform X3 [Schistocerca americana]|nr:protein MIX23 isoform X3 [Schistocerca americana]XP_047001300.1 protein MIX23 isoform X3 [Schistocerca americana]XP_047001301.1 protein MIX23 isoform X3 [Schistocerca americana]XP_047001302.1 protein MIX23 isoform X3 [Schistocerca americana]XP_047105683.1 protein MIX23 isoform X2 [Schistocerca piceifrons]XP_047105691.1 protein MIX23 isoform X2 [Schistocerca piceifrons]XP_049762859.1 protein MIX23 isoform X3 [Schistocerca cancellata]XP_049762860.1 protein MIX23 isoform X3 [Schistocerca can